MQLGQFTGLGETLAHKSHWMMIGIVTSGTTVAIPYYQRVWFTAGEYGVTGLDIGWTFATIIAGLSIVNIGLGIYVHILNIRKKRNGK